MHANRTRGTQKAAAPEHAAQRREKGMDIHVDIIVHGILYVGTGEYICVGIVFNGFFLSLYSIEIDLLSPGSCKRSSNSIEKFYLIKVHSDEGRLFYRASMIYKSSILFW